MHNPFVLYSERLLNALIAAGHEYFVLQEFPRGVDRRASSPDSAFLLTHYNQLNRARIHFEALPPSQKRYLFSIKDPDHKKRLTRAANQPAHSRVYAPLLEKPWRPPEPVQKHIKKYLELKLRWYPTGYERVRANLFVEFGELFLTLSFRTYTEKVPLSDVETI